jgi:threonine dehydratase
MKAGFDFLAAHGRIRGHIRETELIRVEESALFLKCEHRQVTGSFKARGALNRLLGLSADERRRGVVAASAGNHGLGIAYAAQVVETHATVVVPDAAVKAKVEGIRRLGAEVVQVPGGFGAAEAFGLSLAKSSHAVWVSAYNDLAVIEGQGTIGLEIAEQWPKLGLAAEAPRVYVPVSGGGLICGLGLALKGALPGARIIGVQTSAAPYMAVFYAGGDPEQVAETSTLADGLSGPVEPGSVTFDLIRKAADEVRVVDEGSIEEALKAAWQILGEIVEPSAAVPLAAALADRGEDSRLVVLSGGNASEAVIGRLAGGALDSSDL